MRGEREAGQSLLRADLGQPSPCVQDQRVREGYRAVQLPPRSVRAQGEFLPERDRDHGETAQFLELEARVSGWDQQGVAHRQGAAGQGAQQQSKSHYIINIKIFINIIC